MPYTKLTDVVWTSRVVNVGNQMRIVRAPEIWSDRAVTIAASKYLQENENVDDMFARVAEPIAQAGLEKGYFDTAAEARDFREQLQLMMINQEAMFNSPVLFNMGRYPHPQCSACFINSVDDSIDSIMELAKLEAHLFKYGSGTGTNFSDLRASCEAVTGGGKASGPVSFMKGFDAFAGVVKSGGKTRRAAKMCILDVNHPDILEFVKCKETEEKKARALVAAGFTHDVGNPSVFYQNANNSVRVFDWFMNWAIDEHAPKFDLTARKSGQVVEIVSAYQMLTRIAQAAWACGDPGLQFSDTINVWNTCKSTEEIRASNPCSEYTFLDDTSCNLASINLVKFLTEDSFESKRFTETVRLLITAMDIIVNIAGYPSGKIAHKTKQYRALGLGYTNLGAALMRLGLAYDSDEARAWAKDVTALMTREAYKKSGELASRLGPFPMYKQNANSMNHVIRKHADADAADHHWVTETTFRNAQVTLLAPTGTISFLMDCDTTGIEPAVSLRYTKKLADGTEMHVVNESVEPALRRLGFDENAIEHAVEHIKDHGCLSGAKQFDSVRGVFDCALPDERGRCISVDGHLYMMAAVQPFLSGAISKTVNLPETATVEAVRQTFVHAWQLGLKSIAIYRDGSKAVQPIVQPVVQPIVQPVVQPIVQPILQPLKAPLQAVVTQTRRRLPDDRQSITHKFNIAGQGGYLTVGLFEDGTPGELFLRMSKAGSVVNGLTDAWAIAISFGLQHGVPIETLIRKFRYTRFEPAGFTRCADIPTATSIVDYVMQWLERRFGEKKTTDEQQEQIEFAAVWCHECGAQMVRTGTCYACPACGASGGCS